MSKAGTCPSQKNGRSVWAGHLGMLQTPAQTLERKKIIIINKICHRKEKKQTQTPEQTFERKTALSLTKYAVEKTKKPNKHLNRHLKEKQLYH